MDEKYLYVVLMAVENRIINDPVVVNLAYYAKMLNDEIARLNQVNQTLKNKGERQ